MKRNLSAPKENAPTWYGLLRKAIENAPSESQVSLEPVTLTTHVDNNFPVPGTSTMIGIAIVANAATISFSGARLI